MEEGFIAYQTGTKLAMDLPPTHQLRLSLALNFAVFYYEILEETEEAIAHAKRAFSEAIERADQLNENELNEITSILELLKDNMTLWAEDANNV